MMKDEFDHLRMKCAQTILGGSEYDTNDPPIAAAIELVTEQGEFACNLLITSKERSSVFSDIENLTKDNINIQKSYDYLFNMAKAYKTEASQLYNNPKLLQDIIQALEWLYNNHYNEKRRKEAQSVENNWFHWEIGIPLQLNRIMVLLYDELTSTQMNNYTRAIHYFSDDLTLVGTSIDDFPSTSTGANRSWMCLEFILRGIILKDRQLISKGSQHTDILFQYAEDEASNTADGFYRDGSFIQHVNYPCTLAYGTSFLQDIVDIQFLLADSTWDLPSTSKDILYNYIYDSFEPIIYKGFSFDRLRGRGVSININNTHTRIRSIINSFIKLSAMSKAPHDIRLKRLAKYHILENNYLNTYDHMPLYSIIKAKELLNDPMIEPRRDIEAFHPFSSMAMPVQYTSKYGLAISMHSDRIKNYESINNANLKGWHQGDGWIQLLDADQTQYLDMYWPTIDWYRMPGTTVNQNTSQAPHLFNQSDIAGSVEIWGKQGLSGMLLVPEGQSLSAKKSWFLFEGQVVCLGSDINGSAEKMVETIVEQRKLNKCGDNTLIVNGKVKAPDLGWSETMSETSWIHISGNVKGSDVGYYFPSGVSIHAKREARSGSWRDIHSTSDDDNVHTRNYLTLWLDHGLNPMQATYAYVILPGRSRSEVDFYQSKPDISILENSDAVHAVKDHSQDLTGAFFWQNKEHSIAIGNEIKLTSNNVAAVLLHEHIDHYELSIADPSYGSGETITIQLGIGTGKIISADEGVSVRCMPTCTLIIVNVSESRGKTFKVKLRKGRML